MLCLPPIPSDYDLSTPSTVYASLAPLQKKPCEPAGRSYQQYCRSLSGLSEKDIDIESKEEKDADSVEDPNQDDTKVTTPEILCNFGSDYIHR